MQHPDLIVFDLDFTLWYPEMYELEGAPFKLVNGNIFDSAGEQVNLFDDVSEILMRIKTEFLNTKIAVASRTTYPHWANTCLELFTIGPHSLKSVIHHSEIYPENKQIHFQELHQKTGIPFENMLFFDNEVWNCREVEQLGVLSIHTPRGLTLKDFNMGLKRYRNR